MPASCICRGVTLNEANDGQKMEGFAVVFGDHASAAEDIVGGGGLRLVRRGAVGGGVIFLRSVVGWAVSGGFLVVVVHHGFLSFLGM